MTFDNLKHLVDRIKNYIASYSYIQDGTNTIHIGDSTITPELGTNKTSEITDSDIQYPSSNAVKNYITENNKTLINNISTSYVKKEGDTITGDLSVGGSLGVGDNGSGLLTVNGDIIGNEFNANTLIVNQTIYVYKDASFDSNINVKGTITADKCNAINGIFQTSDIRKKDIISDISLDKAYQMIDKCSTILYKIKGEDTEQIGLIAQEVNEFFPEIISKDENGYMSIDYSKLSVILLKTIKDLITRITILENKK